MENKHMKRLLLLTLLAAPLCAKETESGSFLKHTGLAALSTITGASQILTVKALKGMCADNPTSFQKALIKGVYRAPGTALLGSFAANMAASAYALWSAKPDTSSASAYFARIVGPAMMTASTFMPSQGKSLDDINDIRRRYNIEPLKKTPTRELLNATKHATFKATKTGAGVVGASLWAFGLGDIIASGISTSKK